MTTRERARGFLGQAWTRSAHLSRFTAVGIAGLAVNQLLLWLLVSEANVWYLLGAALATVGSTSFNFVGTESWVFRGRGHGGIPGLARRFAAYGAINGAALLVRLPLLYALTEWAHIHYLLGNLISIAALTLVRFAISDRLIWSGSRQIPAEVK
jgi:dolichol-phosphate mannosyltransferase